MTKARAVEFQKTNKIDAFFETSAKSGDNVEDVFALAAKHLFAIHKRPDQQEGIPATPGTGGVTLKKDNEEGGNAPAAKKKCC